MLGGNNRDMKNEIQLWKQYKKWVEAQNKPFVDAYLKREKANMRKYKKDMEEYRKTEAYWKKREDKRWKEIARWDAQPWYKKFNSERPEPLDVFIPRLPLPSMNFYFPVVTVSYENFLDWLAKKKV